MDDNKLAETIGKNLTRLRKLANMTQFELAEKLNYSDKSVSKWEQGNGIPDVRILMQIAELFGVSLDDLVREHVEKEVLPKSAKRRNRFLTVICSVGLCWLVAVCCFVLLGLVGPELSYKWLCFLFAVPASAIVVLVFSCIWHWKWIRIVSISVLVWTVIGCVYLVIYAFTGGTQNLWFLFLIGIPLQALTLIYFVWRRNIHIKK